LLRFARNHSEEFPFAGARDDSEEQREYVNQSQLTTPNSL